MSKIIAPRFVRGSGQKPAPRRAHHARGKVLNRKIGKPADKTAAAAEILSAAEAKPVKAAAVPRPAKAAKKVQSAKPAKPAKSAKQTAQAKRAKAPAAAAALPAQAPVPLLAAPAKAAKTAPPAEPSSAFRREMLSLLPSLRAFAVSLARRADRADDLLQDTIMRAWAKQESFTPGTNMKAWLFTILRNEFYSQMRRQSREVQDTDGYFSNNIAVHPAQYGSLDLQDFKQALNKLPPDQREAIVLIGASGFSYEEAAAICGCALGTIKSRVSRARTRLQTLLGIESENDYGPDAASAAATLRSF